MKNKLLVALLIAALMIFVAGCTMPTGGGPGPRVWIDTPLDGEILALGPVVVKSHASSEGGTASAALLVNGVQVRLDTPTDASAPLTSFAQVWEPTSPGDYGLEVVATDSDGNTGRALVRVQISTEAYVPPLPVCRPDQLVAPELLEPADGASIPGIALRTPVHFAWSYSESGCSLEGFGVRLSEPGGSADISGLLPAVITPSERYTSGDWPLVAGCYYWQVMATTTLDRNPGPPSEVRRFCISSLTASIPGLTTVTASAPLPGITVIPPVIPNLFPTFIFTSNANCRQGPGTAYEVVTSYYANDQVTIEGRNDNSSWYWALIPNSNSHCWVSGTTGSPQGPLGNLVVIPAPALPATTVAPPPVVVVTTPAPAPVAPPAPGKFSISTKSCTSFEYVVALQWGNVNGELGYRIYRDGALIATLPENSTSYDDVSPDYNSHSYQVQAFNAAGSADSSVLNSEGCLY